MGVAIFPDRENRSPRITEMREAESFDWVRVAACGSLITGGLLLLSGRKRAGLVMAASGTAIALLDHEETVRNLWKAMPGYVDRAQYMLEQVQDVVEDIAKKGESLRRTLSRRSPSVRA
ncbi:MAG: hypothetical protein WBQ95_01490 [Terracidiphilus sp.]